MKIAYFDCSSGISGDMILGALVDLGVDLDEIRKNLKKLDLKGYEIRSRTVDRGMISGQKVDVLVKHAQHAHHHSRTFQDIKRMIEASNLSKSVKGKSVDIFNKIAKAEARVHRTTVDKVHFHEVGAVDSIIDIVGGVLGIELLKVDVIYSSPINTGQGTVVCDHGVLPVPAPATLELLQGIPCYSSGIEKELATPTGVAMIGYFAEKFAPMPMMKVSRTGYGAGGHVIKEMPNVLRIILGEGDGDSGTTMCVVETNIDDMNPQFYDHVMTALFSAGAVDVFLAPVQMKKSRPATKLTAIVSPDKKDAVVKILLTETSTFGARFYEVGRVVLDREFKRVKTPFGDVKVKIGKLEGNVLRVVPEYDECKKIAAKKGLPVKKVYEEVLRCAESQLKV
jgi:uncharacterized protein (TIGR00299 family) protein